jgi:hypothetical protein
MQFNAVLKEVRGQLEAALQARPKSIQQLQQRVLGRDAEQLLVDSRQVQQLDALLQVRL